MEVLVPVGIFVMGILVSLVAGGLGIQRIIEAGAGDLGRTAAYIAPFKDTQHDFPESMSRKK